MDMTERQHKLHRHGGKRQSGTHAYVRPKPAHSAALTLVPSRRNTACPPNLNNVTKQDGQGVSIV
jgi:hypothetical protein